MQPKDRVILAIDRITEALTILIRINYDNAAQVESNMRGASRKLSIAMEMLDSFGPFTKGDEG